MRVAQLWRYPVKSLLGERLSEAAFAADGLAGDRDWGILDPATGRILTARREPRLLFARAKLEGDAPRITLPDGRTVLGMGAGTDAALSDWLGRPVTLVA